MSHELLPCPFCGGDANAKPHSQHLPGCYFDAMASLKAAPRGDLSMAPEVVRAWNRRATQPAAGKPIGKVELFGINMTYVEWRDRKMPPLGTELYAAPPAAAHGDEAVQYRLLRVGEIIQATDELLRDDCTTWTPMSEGRQLGIGWGWHAGLMPVRRIDAAMRAQGDGD